MNDRHHCHTKPTPSRSPWRPDSAIGAQQPVVKVTVLPAGADSFTELRPSFRRALIISQLFCTDGMAFSDITVPSWPRVW